MVVAVCVILFATTFYYVSARLPALKLESAASSLATNPGTYVSARLGVAENVFRLYGDIPLTIAAGSGPGTYSSRAWQTFAKAGSDSQSNVAGSYATRLVQGEYTTDVSEKYVIRQIRRGRVVEGSHAITSPYSSYAALLAEVGVVGFALIAAIYLAALGRAWRIARLTTRRRPRRAIRCPRSPRHRGRVRHPPPDGVARELARGDAHHVRRLGAARRRDQGDRRPGHLLTRRRLIVVGPLPPPAHGVTISTSLVLQNPVLRERFDVEHLDTSDHRAGRNVGTWDRQNVWLGVSAVVTLARRLRGGRGIVYLPLSQSTPGFVRDSLLIRVAHRRAGESPAICGAVTFASFYARSNRPSRRWIRRTMSRLDAVAVMGKSLRWVLEGLVPLERITAVPNGTPEPAAVDATRDPERVLFLSNLRRRKGVVQAIDAALLVLQQRPSARFTFAGEWESRELESELRARTAAARSSIEIRPPVHGPEKDALLASSSVLLFPPVEPEGHPRVVLEALASGLPVVTTDRGAILETVIDGQSGFVLDEPDSAELAERIATLLDDGQLRARMGRAARDRYLERYTQDVADHALADWLEGLP